MRRKYGKKLLETNYPSRSTGVRTHDWCHSIGNQMVKVIDTHTHPFNGSFSGTTRVSRYQKGKTNLDFTEARGSEL